MYMFRVWFLSFLDLPVTTCFGCQLLYFFRIRSLIAQSERFLRRYASVFFILILIVLFLFLFVFFSNYH